MTRKAGNPSRKGAAESADRFARIRADLKKKGIDALVDMIVEKAEQDPELLQALEIGSVERQSDDKAFETRLREAIDEAVEVRGYIDYRAAGDWAAGVEMVLSSLQKSIKGKRAGVVRRLVERVADGIGEAFESIDDSDGHLGTLAGLAQDIHLAACRVEKPEAKKLARALFEREMGSEFDAFAGSAAKYAGVLGQTGLAEYKRLAEANWKKVAPRKGPGHNDKRFSGADSRLVTVMDFFAEREGDVETRIAIRKHDLSSQWAYLQLAEFCVAQGREAEALRYAEEGLWLFEDERPDERLVFFVVDRLPKARRGKDAEALLWHAFDREPSAALHARLRKLGGHEVTDRVIVKLEARLKGEKAVRGYQSPDLLLKILLSEKRHDDAWAAARTYSASIYSLANLAAATEKTHPGEAIKVYEARVEALAGAGGGSYEEATKLVARMARLRSGGEQSVYMGRLAERHGRKRNFMKLLGI